MKPILRTLGALRSDTSGMAIVEFAYTLPLLLALGGFGVETANYTSVNHKVSQAALALADNMSRVGANSALQKQQLRESDVVDGFMGVRRQAGDVKITERGRIILSSLQRNAEGGQWIAWQRCMGQKSYSPANGQGTGSTGTGFPGMGKANARITAPPNSAVMFVEIVYDYRGVFGTMFMPVKTIQYEASFVVRDERELRGGPEDNGLYNPSPAVPTPARCNIYSA